MADYNPFCRSNYFKVKDPEAFKHFCERCGVELIEKEGDTGGKLHGFLSDHGIPCYVHDDKTEEDRDIDFLAELAKHLAPTWVAIVQEIGYEKYRYLVGWAFAVNSDGKVRQVSIESIYGKAKKLGEHMTRCEY